MCLPCNSRLARMSDSSEGVTTYSEDERYRVHVEQKKIEEEEKRRKIEEERKNDFLIHKEKLLKNLETYIAADIKYFDHNKIKFKFTPNKIQPIINPKIAFYFSLYYVKKYSFWKLGRINVPLDCRKKFCDLFYGKFRPFPPKDKYLAKIVHEMYSILEEWCEEYKEHLLDKLQRFENGEEVYIYSDEEDLFFPDEQEKLEYHVRRDEILKRMLPPEPRYSLRSKRMKMA